MFRPDFITQENINHWTDIMSVDHNIPSYLFTNPEIMEVLYAGCWLSDELEKLECPKEMMILLKFKAGQLSYKKEPWEVHKAILFNYKDKI